MKYLWVLAGLGYAALNIYVGYIFFTIALSDKMVAKGIALQSAPLLGGIGLAVASLPLIWNCVRLATAKTA
jgi:hypothetical protein